MTPDELSAKYHSYIDCLNQRDWANLGEFVRDNAVHNGISIGLSGYRQMLEADCRAIPDLYFNITILISEPPFISSRLAFNCTPVGMLFGLAVNGKNVRFDENVIYRFDDGKIAEVWSIIDKDTIEKQL